MTNNDIVQKLWNLCSVLRDDGINYPTYITELVLLLFLKMEQEQVLGQKAFKSRLPKGCRWADLMTFDEESVLAEYGKVLQVLSNGMDEAGNVIDPRIFAIYEDAKTSLRKSKHLKLVIDRIDSIEWLSLDEDALGDIYEGLLNKGVAEAKKGPGQYFTPRPLIDSIIRCIKPEPGETIQDPAVGTAGFLIAAHAYIKRPKGPFEKLSTAKKKRQRTTCYKGIELVAEPRRFALMNCLLHGIVGTGEGAIILGNGLGKEGEALPLADIILSNPPFGSAKGSGLPERKFEFATANKQLNFLQHIYTGLKPGGRAAVVLPDNVLFESGVGTEIRRDLMEKCNLHTILRLPTGIFYAAGVKTNVLFFTKGTAKNPDQTKNCTKKVWVYDLRTNMPKFGKRTPFGEQYFVPFEKRYGKKANGTSVRKMGDWSFTDDSIEPSEETSRWRSFSRKWIREKKEDSLDISWLKDPASIDAANLPEPAVLAAEAMSELTLALEELNDLMQAIENPGASTKKDKA